MPYTQETHDLWNFQDVGPAGIQYVPVLSQSETVMTKLILRVNKLDIVSNLVCFIFHTFTWPIIDIIYTCLYKIVLDNASLIGKHWPNSSTSSIGRHIVQHMVSYHVYKCVKFTFT